MDVLIVRALVFGVYIRADILSAKLIQFRQHWVTEHWRRRIGPPAPDQLEDMQMNGATPLARAQRPLFYILFGSRWVRRLISVLLWVCRNGLS